MQQGTNLITPDTSDDVETTGEHLDGLKAGRPVATILKQGKAVDSVLRGGVWTHDAVDANGGVS